MKQIQFTIIYTHILHNHYIYTNFIYSLSPSLSYTASLSLSLVTLRRLLRHDWRRETSEQGRLPPQLRLQRSPDRRRIFIQLVAVLSSRPLQILHANHLQEHPISPHRCVSFLLDLFHGIGARAFEPLQSCSFSYRVDFFAILYSKTLAFA